MKGAAGHNTIGPTMKTADFYGLDQPESETKMFIFSCVSVLFFLDSGGGHLEIFRV